MMKCVFFDRDGIVNYSPGPGYVECWDEFRLIPEFTDILRDVQRHGYEAVIVTNQRGVALGRLSMEAVSDIHARLCGLLREQHDLSLLDILVCPHDDGQCACRKPQPGLLTMAAQRHGIELAASWMIGDKERDVEAGRRAGCRTILVSAGDAPTAANVHVRDLSELRDRIDALLTLTPA